MRGRLIFVNEEGSKTILAEGELNDLIKMMDTRVYVTTMTDEEWKINED